MREILFKGQRVDTKEWVEGFLFVRKDTRGEIIDCFIIEDCYEQINYGIRCVQSLLNKECFRVIPETVGQYTGKKIGKEKLFEGDIVETHGYYDDYEVCKTFVERAVVVWDEKNSCWAVEVLDCETNEKYKLMFEEWFSENTEVIGNIHDNPELLGGDKE